MKGGSDEKNAVYAVRSLPAFALCRLRTAAPDDIQQVPVSPLRKKWPWPEPVKTPFGKAATKKRLKTPSHFRDGCGNKRRCCGKNTM